MAENFFVAFPLVILCYIQGYILWNEGTNNVMTSLTLLPPDLDVTEVIIANLDCVEMAR